MSNIDSQIKALLLKKKKIDYVSYIADLVKNDTKCHDFKDVKSEVVSKIEPFLIELMTAIESDSDVKTPKDESKPIMVDFLSSDEQKAIKLVAQAALKKVNQLPSQTDTPSKPVKTQAEVSPSDKMNFAMSNRHLANKRVQVINDNNVQILGKIVGLDAPNVVVKTDTGPTIDVPLNKIVLE